MSGVERTLAHLYDADGIRPDPGGEYVHQIMSSSPDAQPDGRDETASERSDRNWSEILQELRITQTGSQIISGFLLTVAFQPRFVQLDGAQLVLYGILVALAASSTLLGVSTVMVHRTQFGRRDKPQVVVVGDRLLIASVLVVAMLAAGVLLLIFDVAFGWVAGIIAFVITLAALLVLLVVLPRSLRRS